MMVPRGMEGAVDEAKRRLINGQHFDVSFKSNANGSGAAAISLTELQAVAAYNDSTMLNSVENDNNEQFFKPYGGGV